MKDTAYEAVRWSALSLIGKAVLQFLQIAVLARLLAPEDFGLMAILLALSAFVLMFSDLGINTSIIQSKNCDRNTLSSLYWLNLTISSVLALTFFLLSEAIAWVFEKPELTPLLKIMSGIFFITAIGQHFRTLAEKALRFKAIALIEISSALISFSVAVALALAGKGVYALVAAALCQAFTNSIGSLIFLSRGRLPGAHFDYKETLVHLKFGMYLSGYHFVNSLQSQADLFLGGRIMGASALGIYSLPREISLRLASSVSPVVSRVGLPLLSQSRSDNSRYRILYLKTLRFTVSISFPVYACLAVFSDCIVDVLLGEQWESAKSILLVLSLWGAIRSINIPAGLLAFSSGQSKLAFKWSLLSLFVIAPVITIGANFQALGLALASLTSSILLIVPAWWYLVRSTSGIEFVEFSKEILPAFLCSILAGSLGYYVAVFFEMGVAQLVAGVMTLCTSYIIASYYLNRTWVDAVLKLVHIKRQ